MLLGPLISPCFLNFRIQSDRIKRYFIFILHEKARITGPYIFKPIWQKNGCRDQIQNYRYFTI